MDSKPKSNALLKTLPEDRQEQIAEWCAKANEINPETGRPIPRTGGLAYAREQLAADGLKVSLQTLSDFFSWWKRRWKMRTALEASEHQRELMEKFRPEDKQLAREFAEFTLLQKASDLEDKDLFSAVVAAQDSRRSGDLKERELEAKINGFKARYEQKERELKLAQEKHLASLRTKIEQGLAALREAITGNAPAEAALAKLEASIEG